MFRRNVLLPSSEFLQYIDFDFISPFVNTSILYNCCTKLLRFVFVRNRVFVFRRKRCKSHTYLITVSVDY
jgi:hypothetical protein